MPDITQTELQQLVRHDASSVGKAEEAVVRKHSNEAHSPGVEQAFVAQIAEGCMAVHDLDLFADENLSQMWKRGEDGWEGRGAVHHPMREVIDLESVGQVSDAGSAGVAVVRWPVGVGDDYDLVAAVNELLVQASEQVATHLEVWKTSRRTAYLRQST
jgi:hypothetical protein